MNRYSIDIDELIAFADRLRRFNQRAEEIAAAVDQEIAKLQTTWEGLGAESERDYHQDWMRRAREMRETSSSCTTPPLSRGETTPASVSSTAVCGRDARC